MAEIAKLIATVGADISGLKTGMNEANGLLGNMGGVMKTAVIGAAAAGGAALVGFGAKSADVAADFESQMNVLSVAAAGSGVSLEDLRSAALLIGADTQLVGISASEAADAMTNFAKAGLTTTDMFGNLNTYLDTGTDLSGALRAAIDLQAASELDLAAASDVVAVAMATFGLEAADATRIADSFVSAADASTANVSDLAAAMTNVGPTAAAFGWSLEDTNQALAILSTRGISGAEAGTALRSMMTNMLSTSDATAIALSSLNVELYNSDGVMRSLPDIIGDLSTALATTTEEQRNQYVQTLAGTYGMKAMNTLVAEGVPGWESMGEAIDSAATAQTSAAARTQGFNAAMEQLGGVIETFMISVGTPLIENFLTPGVKLLTEWISELSLLIPSQEAASAAFDTVKTAIGGIVDTVSGIVQSGDPLGTLWTLIKTAALEAWPGIKTTLETAIGNMISGVTAWVTTNAPVYGALLWTALKGWVDTAVAYVSGNAATWGDTIGGYLGPAISAAVAWITTNAPTYATELWTALKGWVDGAIAKAGEFYATWGDTIGAWLGSALSAAAGWLVTNYIAYLTFLWTSFNKIFTLLVGYVGDNYKAWGDTIGGHLGSALSAAAAWVATNVPIYAAELWATLNTWVADAITSFSGGTAASGTTLGTHVGSVLKGAVDWVVTNVPVYAGNLWTALSGVLSSALTSFSDNSESWGTSYGAIVGTVIRYAIGGVALLASELWKAIQGLFDSATGTDEGGEDKALELATGLLSLFTGFWNGFITGITANPQWHADLTAWIDTTILQPFRDIDLIEPIKAALGGIITGTTEKAEEISTAIQDIVDRILNPFKNLDLTQIGRDMIAGLKDGISGAAGSVTDAVGNAAGDAVGWAKDRLGIGSPSRVFADIGADMMRGMELGIERHAYRPREAVGQSASHVSNTFNLNANYGGQMPGNLEVLLAQLLQGMRSRGYSVPLPDMGG